MAKREVFVRDVFFLRGSTVDPTVVGLDGGLVSAIKSLVDRSGAKRAKAAAEKIKRNQRQAEAAQVKFGAQAELESSSSKMRVMLIAAAGTVSAVGLFALGIYLMRSMRRRKGGV